MRELNFRAWDNVKKEWLLGYEYPNLGGFSIFGEMMMMGEWSNVLQHLLNGYFGKKGEELKVTQYTGLKDKNGVEIYENDIVKVDNDVSSTFNFDSRVGVVRYFRGTFVLADKDGRWLNTMATFNVISDAQGECVRGEVIGNIYQNPDLCTK